MKLSMMELAEQAGARPMAVCPYCDRRMVNERQRRRQVWWQRAKTGLAVAWVIGLGVLAAEIVIEDRIIAEQWAMLERVERLMELRSGPVRGR